MKQADIRDATFVKFGNAIDGYLTERIKSKWGVAENGTLAKPSEGGFGCITESGDRIDMFSAHSYWKE